uniref:DNA-directed DNA polymerase n=1 Tax=Coniferiporia sulphurascens TaxID=175648 RepID=A0A5B9RCM8_CONSH|nr:DNA polymerase family B [Coniferiporia sulphurascens]QEG57193.1 DNA polymerase family B [Coniferiporia sulphurascens]
MYNNSLGIYKVNVTAPDISHPILPFRHNNTTVFGAGTWTGWYFSEELKNAEKYGYQFEILSGYLFKSEDIFSKYIDDLYKMKASADSTDPMYLIAKILMNSLYGRYGLSPDLASYSLADSETLDKAINKQGVENLDDTLEIGELVLYSFKNNKENASSNSNVAIALAVSAYSRILMSQFKNNPQYNLYYSDTDSIFIDKPLDPSFVDDKTIGKLKLEHVLSKLVALGAKMYGGVTDSGKEFTKVKGLKNKLSVADLELLLQQDTTKVVDQSKWFKSLTNGR